MYAPLSRNVFWIYGALQIKIIIIIISTYTHAAVGLLQLWGYYSCGVTTAVGLLQLWGYYSCGVTTAVGLLQLWGYNSCGVTTVVGLQQLWGYYSCGVTTAVGLLQLWGYYSCGVTTVVGLLKLWGYNSCGVTTAVGLLQLWGYYSCGVTTAVGLLQLWGYYSCGVTAKHTGSTTHRSRLWWVLWGESRTSPPLVLPSTSWQPRSDDTRPQYVRLSLRCGRPHRCPQCRAWCFPPWCAWWRPDPRHCLWWSVPGRPLPSGRPLPLADRGCGQRWSLRGRSDHPVALSCPPCECSVCRRESESETVQIVT